MTRDQALAFVEAAVKSSKMKAHLEGAIGYGRVPETEDFDSAVEDSQDRAEELASYLADVAGVLQATISKVRETGIQGRKGKRTATA